MRAERQDIVEVAADRRCRLGRRVDLDARQRRPHLGQEIVLHLCRQVHLGVAGGVGELLPVRQRVLDEGAGLLGDGLRELDVGRAERARRAGGAEGGDAGIAGPDGRDHPAVVPGRRRRGGILPDVDLGVAPDPVQPAADAPGFQRRSGRGDDLGRTGVGQQRDEAQVGLEEPAHFGCNRLQRQRQVELVPAGAGQVVERENLVLAIDELRGEQITVTFASNERRDDRRVHLQPDLGTRLRPDQSERQLGRIGNGGSQVWRGRSRTGRPTDDPGATLEQPEGRRLAEPGPGQPFQGGAHQGRTDRGRHYRGELARTGPGRSTTSGPQLSICSEGRQVTDPGAPTCRSARARGAPLPTWGHRSKGMGANTAGRTWHSSCS